jgi:hypothetical protein
MLSNSIFLSFLVLVFSYLEFDFEKNLASQSKLKLE